LEYIYGKLICTNFRNR